MKKVSKLIMFILIFIINLIIFSNINTIFAQTSYLRSTELTFRKLENGETLLSGFKIGEKVSGLFDGKFAEDYELKVINNDGIDITENLSAKIGTGYKIELYEEETLAKTYTIVLFGDTNGDAEIGAADALAVVKNKAGIGKFTEKAQEEAGRILNDTRMSLDVPKADDALYIIKYKLYPEEYQIDQKMLQKDEEEKKEDENGGRDTNGDGIPDVWDTNGDGKDDAWDTDGDGKPDAWDTDGDGKPDAWDTDGDGNADLWDENGNGSKITITKTPTTPRNTSSTGTQNGIEKGPITVTIDFGETELQKQYKIETDTNWTTVEGTLARIEVTENTNIIARYFDGKNSYKTTSISIQNVDNIPPTFQSYDATVNGKVITATAEANDTADEGAYPGTEGILRYEYSIDGVEYQTQNTFTINKGGNYTIYIKAIDKAGNETIVNKTVTINEYTIYFNATGGEVTPTSKKVIQNAEYGELPVPTKTGYTFVGWFTEETGGTKIESTTIANITEDQTLYAHWTLNNYTLTIKHYLENANDTNYSLSTTTTTQNIAYGTQITLAEFATSITNGTYKQGSLTENGTAATTTAMGTNTTIYLYYSRNKYKLTLNKGNYIETVEGEANYKVGQTVTINATLKANETGYTNSFVNWTSSNTSLIQNNENQRATITMPGESITLTANGTRTANKYTLTVKHYLENANDTNYTLSTTTTAQNITYGTQITLANYATSITNGTYKQGSLTENGTAATTTTMGTNTTIYLYYSRDKYKLTLSKGNYINTVTGEGDYKVGQNVTIGATLQTETGYSISWSGWTSNNIDLLANNPTQNTTITMPKGAVTLTATATRTANNYTVTCIDKVDSTDGETLGSSTFSAAFGTTVYGSHEGSNTEPDEYYEGYYYSSCTSATVTTSGTTVYRIFKHVNEAPILETPTVYSRSTTYITIRARATDADTEDKLTYKLYVKTENGSYPDTPNATSAETASGTYVNLQATSLSEYTVYKYKVEVTDGKTTVTSVEGTTSTGHIGTTCTNITKSTRVCGTLNWNRTQIKNWCSTCNAPSVQSYKFSCSSCNYQIEFDECENSTCSESIEKKSYIWRVVNATNKNHYITTFSCLTHGYSTEMTTESNGYDYTGYTITSHQYCSTHGKNGTHYPN